MTELLSTHSRTNVLEQGPSPARGQGARLLGAGAVFEWRPRLWPATSVRLGESHSRGVGFDSGLSAAADHLDRSRGILCGCAGEIVGWVWPADAVGGASQEATKIWNELPACILVRFKTKTTWRAQGIDEDNVFPVAPQKKPWYLDKGRRRPVLRVTRKQRLQVCHDRPRSPRANLQRRRCHGHAHWRHGRPIDGVHCVNACPRQAWFICVQTLPCSTVWKGRKSRAGIAVAVLGWWKLDWSALRAKYRDECNESKPPSSRRVDGNVQMRGESAKECIRRHVEAQQPWQCMACTAWKQEDAVMAKHVSPQATFYRICATCEQSQWCSVCKTRKDEPKFSAAAWQRARNGGRVCLACLGKAWGWWRCTVCKVKQAAWAFESWLAQHRSCNGDQVCSNFWKRPLPRGSISKRYNG